jgi:hypothetical protein
MSQAPERLPEPQAPPPPGRGLEDRNRQVARILLTVMAVLAMLGLLAGIRW